MAVGTGTGEMYATALDELWSGLARTLGRLESTAAEPSRLDEIGADHALRRLQYSLHLACEHAYGLAPPLGAEGAHAELKDALATARDATAEVAEATSLWGAEGASELLLDWRGALFRVRLARMRLASAPRPRPADPPAAERESLLRPLAAFLLSLFGAVAFVAGATLGVWPVWVLGVLAVCCSLVAYRP